MSALNSGDVEFLRRLENTVFLAMGEKTAERIYVWSASGCLMRPLDERVKLNGDKVPSASLEMMRSSVHHAETLLSIIRRMGEEIEDLIKENACLRRGEELE